MTERVIYTRWLAQELQKRNHCLLRTGTNPKCERFVTWIFKDTPELEQDLTSITQSKRQRG